MENGKKSLNKETSQIHLNKDNLEIVLKTVLWYGSGYHSRYTSIPIKIVKDIFEINNPFELQKLYNILNSDNGKLGVYGVCFVDGSIEMENMLETPILVLSNNKGLAIRTIVYSFKDDIDDVSIAIEDFVYDLLNV